MEKTFKMRKANYERIEKLMQETYDKAPNSNISYAFIKGFRAMAKLVSETTGEKVTAQQISAWNKDWWEFGGIIK
jgi:hypothetical protein